jgi:hypothetical protein
MQSPAVEEQPVPEPGLGVTDTLAHRSPDKHSDGATWKPLLGSLSRAQSSLGNGRLMGLQPRLATQSQSLC